MRKMCFESLSTNGLRVIEFRMTIPLPFAPEEPPSSGGVSKGWFGENRQSLMA